MAGGREGRGVGARQRGLGRWLDRMLAERMSEIDWTYARLEGRASLSVDDALEQLDDEAAERALRRW